MPKDITVPLKVNNSYATGHEYGEQNAPEIKHSFSTLCASFIDIKNLDMKF